MVSDSWEMAQNLQGDAVLCQDQCKLKMEAQMSIFFDLHMIFEPGLTKMEVKFPLEAIEMWSHFQHDFIEL